MIKLNIFFWCMDEAGARAIEKILGIPKKTRPHKVKFYWNNKEYEIIDSHIINMLGCDNVYSCVLDGKHYSHKQVFEAFNVIPIMFNDEQMHLWIAIYKFLKTYLPKDNFYRMRFKVRLRKYILAISTNIALNIKFECKVNITPDQVEAASIVRKLISGHDPISPNWICVEVSDDIILKFVLKNHKVILKDYRYQKGNHDLIKNIVLYAKIARTVGFSKRFKLLFNL